MTEPVPFFSVTSAPSGHNEVQCLQPRDGRYEEGPAAGSRIGWTLSLYVPGSGTERFRQILRARRLGISVCLGTASTAPVMGFVQREWERPSRLKWQPC